MDNRKILFDKYRLNNLGFTLIELLMAMALATLVLAGIFSAYQNQQNIQLVQKQGVEMQQNLRIALSIMTSEIKKAGYDPSGTNGAGILNAGDGSDDLNRLVFTYFNTDAPGDGNDNDNDGAIDEAGENLQAIEFYRYDSLGDGTMDLGRRDGARLDAIAENIQTLQFVYLDENGNLTVTLDEIRAVQITVQATTDVNERNLNTDRTLTTTVKFRNLGL